MDAFGLPVSRLQKRLPFEVSNASDWKANAVVVLGDVFVQHTTGIYDEGLLVEGIQHGW